LFFGTSRQVLPRGTLSVENYGDPGRGAGVLLAGDGFSLAGIPRSFCMSLVAPFSPAIVLVLKG
jgi:hypothetical protein